ncbi:MAG: phosphodiester glycosidase family protein, partial [Clostridia bacterium]|nr:phosphodiester glycosidase family protein [Clostridia bacterium]
MKKILAAALALLMVMSIVPMSMLASAFDASVTGDYFKVISEDKYALAPGATEIELVVNNADGTDRKVVHYFEVDTTNENIEVLPGYYGIDKLNPDNLAGDSAIWKAEQLTKTVAYYESLGYNVVGAMNTALAYDSNAPYGYMVMNGVVLGTPQIHPGAQTYLAIYKDGTCELRSMSTPLDGNEWTCISANFGWLVKDGKLTSTAVERTSSDASRSMIGIKADGTLVFCQVDGRNAPFSSGLSNYEMGEMMLALGCVNAVNCDGGGSSTFVSKREGESENTMRSVPSDGSERATINSVILVSKAKATGEFDHAVLDSEYDYYAPGTYGVVTAKGVDAAGSPAELPAEGITYVLSDAAFGTIANDGSFKLNNVKGDVTVKMLYNGEVVGEKVLHVVDPEVFALALDETVLPYGKSMTIDFACTYGADDWAVCVDGAYSLALSDATAATLTGTTLVAVNDESVKGVNVVATYLPNTAVTDTLKITYGKGSEVLFDFENGDISMFPGMDEMYDWAEENGAAAPIQGDGNYSELGDSFTFLSTDVVRNGSYSLGVTLDYTDAEFAGWSYNMFFYTADEALVLRDVANGKNATTLGVWVYIPEGAAGLAMQIQGHKNPNGTGGTGAHFMFTTVSGAKKNLNSCTEADIPESRWVYATVDLTQFGDFFATYDPYGTNGREPSFIRYYVKPMTPANLTFYFDDFTLDYSSAVDDRVLPTITDVSYTTADESVVLNNGAVITGSSISFSAVVADNIKLDNTTGKIYLDGNELTNVAISGKYLTTTTNVAITPGVHTVAFEIKDTLGNPAKVTRTFTITGDAQITLGGHNDSGKKPEYDSVYYVDVNVADITAIYDVTTSIKLQSANTWEPQGITVADGFKVSYEFDELNGVISLTIERNGEAVDASATTLVSIPVRVWSWGGINHVTDTPVAPQTQFATGYCPIVTIDYTVTQGLINGTDVFGGSKSVETMLNDNVNPWHYHDTELTVLNQAATCTKDGFENRTYCETCQSVVDWGTIIPASGHNYVIVDGKYICDNCGEAKEVTDLVEIDGKTYYFINGVAASGWQMIGTDWYYFDTTTKIGADGDVKIGLITYNFVDGKLTSGVWAPTLLGWRYYYGPSFYNDRGSWRTIDGKDYFFEKGVRLEGGYQLVFENQKNKNWYYFNEDGTCDKSVKLPDGFYTDRNGYAYSKDGEGLAGLQMIDGKYYYFDSKGYAKTNGTYANVLFKDTYEAYTGFHTKDGVLYYYVNGKTATNGLYEIDGDYYYVYWGGVVKTDGRYYIGTTFCDLPAGNYTFGADGKMLN